MNTYTFTTKKVFKGKPDIKWNPLLMGFKPLKNVSSFQTGIHKIMTELPGSPVEVMEEERKRHDFGEN